MFLGKGVLKICSKFTGEYPFRSVISVKLHGIFWEHLFLRTTLGSHHSFCEFQPPDIVKNYFTGAFQAFCTSSRSSHSEEFIYLKSLKTICEEVNLLRSCEMPTCNFTKKALLHSLLHVFFLHFLRIHFFSKGALKVWEHKFFLENVSGKECYL